MNRFLLGLAFSICVVRGVAAQAEATCKSGVLINHRVASICGSVTVPDHGVVTTHLDCNGYSIAVYCDMASEPNKLTLTMTSPSGETETTSSEKEVHMTDANGYGAVVGCSL